MGIFKDLVPYEVGRTQVVIVGATESYPDSNGQQTRNVCHKDRYDQRVLCQINPNCRTIAQHAK